MSLQLLKTHRPSQARAGVLNTKSGGINTPFFMPIATRAAVRSLGVDDLSTLGAEIVLGNTYHLYEQPGDELIAGLGGLHRFMNWSRPILTDSGGYQVYSLADHRRLSDEGVNFKSLRDGSRHLFTPEKVIDIQLNLDSDILMVLDECPPYPSDKKYVSDSLELTTAWAKRSWEYFASKVDLQASRPLLFGIVQGSIYPALRQASAAQLLTVPFDGYAIGGISVGEPAAQRWEAVNAVLPLLPEDKPRYLMGVGQPHEIVQAVSLGVDMFDCVLPTRAARHGTLYVWRQGETVDLAQPEKMFYETFHLTNERFKADGAPVDATCQGFCCQTYSRAYLHHLFKTHETLGLRLATIHNLRFYLDMMRRLREQIV